MEYLAAVAALFAIWAVMALSLDIALGLTGIFSVAHAALVALGAYTYAVLTVRLGVNEVVAIVASVAIAAGVASIIGLVTLSIGGDQYIVVSLAVQALLVEVALRWDAVTGGASGIYPVPSATGYGILGAATCVAIAMLAVGGLLFLYRTSFAYRVRAVREELVSAAASGIRVFPTKVLAFTLSAGLAGFAGAIYAGYLGVVVPGSFTVHVSVMLAVIVILGGAGNPVGVLLGAAILIGLPELLKNIDVPWIDQPGNQLIVFGILLILIVRFRPQGLLPERRPRPRVVSREPEPRPEPAAVGKTS